MFNKIFAGKPDHLMIDTTHLKAHRTAASLLKKVAVPRCIGCTKGGFNSKRTRFAMAKAVP
ncbi:transposase IS5 [Aurantiacibacter atlanticus]|uniref:Transposase IS5 n=1 Tax=Aurantiacibacter atlanticus TaxID=1648404 RepID=A0A161I4B1_9SPHN|nr:transposase IS5 [Aurantiacibacter atlanticus]